MPVQKHECRSPARLYFPVKEVCGDFRRWRKPLSARASGFDYLPAEKNRAFLRELCQYHVSGQLSEAPEHISDNRDKNGWGKPEKKRFTASS
ncbi:MAG: hypothetical protein ACLTR6_05830 [Clostridium fessum]